MGKILDRMSELRTMAQDITKNTSDVRKLLKEFLELQRQLSQTYREKFNGVSLFSVKQLPSRQPITPSTQQEYNRQ